MRLFYVPLEPYIERYTYFMSAVNGWAENHFRNNNIDFVRVDGTSISNTIKDGVVLDASGRCYYALSQIMKLVELIENGEITNDDVIYLEDFWHPGVESLFYIRQLKKMSFKIGTFIHAQSVDDTDFAWKMKDWMRPMEQGMGIQYDYIFTCSHILRQLCIVAGIAREDNIFHIGLPYNSTRLLTQLHDMGFKPADKKEDFVLFASRFDDEKDPMFFLDLVEACPDIQFKLVNPRSTRSITSNQEVVDRLNKITSKENSNLEVVDTSNKLTYYGLLSRAKIVFNCANQDWVSWTLLEAITFGCNPLYPIWKDFEYELKGNPKYLYEKRNLAECKEKLYQLINKEFNRNELQYIVEKHNNSWNRYLQTMKFLD